MSFPTESASFVALKSYFVELASGSYEVRLEPKAKGGYQADVTHGESVAQLQAERFSGGILVEGHVYRTSVRSGERVHVRAASVAWLATVRDRRHPPELASAGRTLSQQGIVRSPIPGQVTEVLVRAGDTVEKGQALLTLEAMKMQNSIVAEHSGSVEKVWVMPGDSIQADASLIEIKA